jgi:hypothetical protein
MRALMLVLCVSVLRCSSGEQFASRAEPLRN